MVERFSDLRFERQRSISSGPDAAERSIFALPREQQEIYSRSCNPAVIALCQTLAHLEQAEACAVTSYGFGAIISLCLAHLKQGDHILVTKGCFGPHQRLFADYMASYGVDMTMVAADDFAQWQAGVCSTTRMAFTHLPVVDERTLTVQAQAGRLARLSSTLAAAGYAGQSIQLVVDNTQHTAHGFKPLNHGADFVIYTSTKALDIPGRVVAGAICGKDQPMEPVTRCMQKARVCVSPFNAWVILRSLGAVNTQVLDHILGVGSMDDTGKVVSLSATDRQAARGYQAQ